MKYRFSDSASGPARFVSKGESSSVDITFSSAMTMGGNANRMSKLSSNLEAMANTLRSNIGLSKDDFYRGGDYHAVRASKVSRGMGFERT